MGAGVLDDADAFNKFELLRFNPDGSLDASFGTGGRVVTPFGNFSGALSVGLQSDGRIIVTGEICPDSAVLRYNTDGSLDDGGPGDSTPGDFFGSAATPGRFTHTFNSAVFCTSNQVVDVEILPDDRIVGVVRANFVADTILFRLMADGSAFDTTFGATGIVFVDFGGLMDEPGSAIDVDVSGRYVVSANVRDSTSSGSIGIARVLPDGTLDSSFNALGTPGIQLVSVSGFKYGGRDVVVLPSGKIVASGVPFASEAPLLLAALNDDGSIDTDFGTGGVFQLNLPSARQSAFGLAVLPSGQIVAAVLTENSSGVPTGGGIIVVNPDGTLAGQAIDSRIFPHSVAIQPDGKAVIWGFTASGPDLDFAVARFLCNSPPVAVDDSYQINEDGELIVNAANGVLSNDSDPESDSLSAQVTMVPANGSLDFHPDGSFTYTPSADFSGMDVFSYEVSDGNGGVAAATVIIDVLSAGQQINSAIFDVEELVNLGVLNNGQGNALTSKLNKASKKLDQGNTNAGINQLEAFINQIEAFINGGILDDDEGEALIAEIAATIVSAG